MNRRSGYLLVLVILLGVVIVTNINVEKSEKQRAERWVSVKIEPDREFDSMMDEGRRRLRRDNVYHEIFTLINGVRVGQLGAFTWLIDSVGSKISSGYHEIEPKENGGYFAELGSRKYQLSETGKAILIKEIRYE